MGVREQVEEKFEKFLETWYIFESMKSMNKKSNSSPFLIELNSLLFELTTLKNV